MEFVQSDFVHREEQRVKGQGWVDSAELFRIRIILSFLCLIPYAHPHTAIGHVKKYTKQTRFLMTVSLFSRIVEIYSRRLQGRSEPSYQFTCSAFFMIYRALFVLQFRRG